MFNQNSELNPEQIRSNAQKIFEEVKNNLLRSHNRVIKSNSTKENPPKIDENQDVFVLPNIRTKTQPRAHKTTAHQITDKTFKNTGFPTIYWSVPMNFWLVPINFWWVPIDFWFFSIIYWYFPIGYQYNWNKNFWETAKKSWERTKKIWEYTKNLWDPTNKSSETLY